MFHNSIMNLDHLYLIGYSFPEADSFTRYTLKHALASNKKPNLKITIVNKQRNGNEYYNRIKNFFGLNYNYNIVNDGFEEFVKRPSF
jgi:hypothetical protein